MRKYKDFIGPRDKHGRVLSYQARTNKEEIRTRAKEYAPKRRKRNQEIKLFILAYYGPNKELCCSWKDCNVIDPDMLTIDHINNDGAIDRKSRGGKAPYRRLIAQGYPEGYQTLCNNHQWKKEMMRRRGESNGN